MRWIRAARPSHDEDAGSAYCTVNVRSCPAAVIAYCPAPGGVMVTLNAQVVDAGTEALAKVISVLSALGWEIVTVPGGQL